MWSRSKCGAVSSFISAKCDPSLCSTSKFKVSQRTACPAALPRPSTLSSRYTRIHSGRTGQYYRLRDFGKVSEHRFVSGYDAIPTERFLFSSRGVGERSGARTVIRSHTEVPRLYIIYSLRSDWIELFIRNINKRSFYV